MTTRTKVFLLALVLFISGCGMEDGQIVTTEAQRVAVKTGAQRRGEARIALFKECMKLASKITRQADDDVSDIVKECSSQAHYATNYLR